MLSILSNFVTVSISHVNFRPKQS